MSSPPEMTPPLGTWQPLRPSKHHSALLTQGVRQPRYCWDCQHIQHRRELPRYARPGPEDDKEKDHVTIQ